MSITLIEGFILLMVAAVGVILWWGILRIVSTGEQTLAAFSEIQRQLGVVNGRLGKIETWTEMHQANDQQQFQGIHEQLRRIWETVEKSRSE